MNREYVEVDMLEWKKAKSPAIIETDGLGPCIGIIIYCPITKQAWVGHFVDPRYDRLTEMLRDVVSSVPETENLYVYLGGGEADTEDLESIENDKERKTFVLAELKKIGIDRSKIKIRYNDLEEIASMKINTRNGDVKHDIVNEQECLYPVTSPDSMIL